MRSSEQECGRPARGVLGANPLCTPQLVFMSYPIPERGDAKWLDHQGSYMATVTAQPVFQLLGTHARRLKRPTYREDAGS